jgi:RNA polymerase sigma factor (sigma-70 family)
VEASALHAPAGFARGRIALGTPLLRLRSDEQLVALFRDGDEDAFRVIHDRYRTRLFAYARQMLDSRQDAEDVLQDVFVRAYAALRHSNRELALRAWLYRIAHNRCVDQLRRPAPPAPEALGRCLAPVQDPAARAEERDSLRRLIADLQRLPDQQRSALLMRELGGMSYDELSMTLAISLPAVKSVLVRARVSLAQAVEARETACEAIRDELILAHDGRRRPAALARRHLRDCPGCREFRGEVRSFSRQLAALAPALGPLGVLANALGLGGGGAAAGGSAAAGSGVLTGGSAAAGSGLLTGSSALAGGLGHVATILAAAAVTAGGAVEIQHQLATVTASHPGHHLASRPAVAPATPLPALAASVGTPTGGMAATVTPSPPPVSSAAASGTTPRATPPGRSTSTRPAASRDTGAQPVAASALDPGMGPGPGGGADPVAPTATGGTGAAAGSTVLSAPGADSSTVAGSTGGSAGGPLTGTAGSSTTPTGSPTAPNDSSTSSGSTASPTSPTASGSGTGTGTGTGSGASTTSVAKSSGTSRS